MSAQTTPISQVHILPQTGGGVTVLRDQRVRVTCLQGKQVGDLFAFIPGSRGEYLSPSYTLRSLGRLYPEVGKPL
ncbi:MAG: urea carboxylase-associated family protein, partial [SAR202 cluster bacterium]|nr:urea carboxylase-associated family protein [SAR202 cluster bacterium]